MPKKCNPKTLCVHGVSIEFTKEHDDCEDDEKDENAF